MQCIIMTQSTQKMMKQIDISVFSFKSFSLVLGMAKELVWK